MKIIRVEEARIRSYQARVAAAEAAATLREAKQNEQWQKADKILAERLPVWMNHFNRAVEDGDTRVSLKMGESELSPLLQKLVEDMFRKEGYSTKRDDEYGEYSVLVSWQP